MLSTLNILGPLWRRCTSSIVKVDRWGGVWAPNPRLLSSILSRPVKGRWSSGKIPGSNPGDPRFDSGTTLSGVVSPTQRRRIAASRTMGA